MHIDWNHVCTNIHSTEFTLKQETLKIIKKNKMIRRTNKGSTEIAFNEDDRKLLLELI